MAPYVPPDDIIKKGDWFEKFCNATFEKYLATDATTKKGLQHVAKANQINDLDENLDAGDMYTALLKKIAEAGAYKNFYMSALEGYHRVTGLTHALVRSSIDQGSGLVKPDTISVKNFLSVQLGVKNKIDDKNLQDKMRDAFFGKNQALPVMNPFTTKVYYASKQRLTAKTTMPYVIRVSRAIAEGKKQSVTKCPFAMIGNLLADTLESITDDQMTFRAKFDDITYPTYPPHKLAKVQKTLASVYGDDFGNGMAEDAYPYCDLLDHEVYQRFLKDPLSDETKAAVIKLLERDVIPDAYHLRPPEAVDLKKRLVAETVKAPSKLSFPFYPSFPAMSHDVEEWFDYRSYMNPYVANNMILGPIIYTILYAAIENRPVHECLKDEKLKAEIHYWLRFHNNFSHKSTVLEIHMAYDLIYKIGGNTPLTLSDNCAMILGATHMIVNMFNSVLCCTTEKALCNSWDVRKKSLTEASHILRNSFNRIGTTVAGREVPDVVKLLGKGYILVSSEHY